MSTCSLLAPFLLLGLFRNQSCILDGLGKHNSWYYDYLNQGSSCFCNWFTNHLISSISANFWGRCSRPHWERVAARRAHQIDIPARRLQLMLFWQCYQGLPYFRAKQPRNVRKSSLIVHRLFIFTFYLTGRPGVAFQELQKFIPGALQFSSIHWLRTVQNRTEEFCLTCYAIIKLFLVKFYFSSTKSIYQCLPPLRFYP